MLVQNASKTGFPVLLVMLALSASPAVHAMQNEPADFLGVVWGTPLDSVRGELRVISEDGAAAHFRRPADRPFFAGIEVRRISYYFYEGSFTSGTFLTVGTNDLKTMVNHLTDRHGPPKTVNPRHRVYAWEGERTGITVSCDITVSCYTEVYDRDLRLKELSASDPAAKGDD